MTGSSPPDGTVGISADVVQVLLVSGLMKRFAVYITSGQFVEDESPHLTDTTA